MRSTLAMSVWLGLVVGMAEVELTGAQKLMHDPSPGFFRMNRHMVWTIPMVDLALFGLGGLVLVLIGRIWPRRSVPLSGGLLAGASVLIVMLSIRRLHPLAGVVLACGFGYRAAHRVDLHYDSFRRLVRWTLPVLAVGMLGMVYLSLGRHVQGERRAMASIPAVAANGPNAPNVLLVVMDTVRADRLSLYGYDRDTTPNLARLARRGIRFDQARSTAPWTLPSHASMMTGRWPHQLSARLHGPLDGTYPTLAEYLAARGYATAGFIANTTYCSAEAGIARGFAHYADHDLSPPALLRTSALGRRLVWPCMVFASELLGGDLRPEPVKDAARISGDALAWTERLDQNRPFFVFLNYLDAHTPYLPPVGFNRFFGVKPESRAELQTLNHWFTADKAKLSQRDYRLASDTYDDCIAFIDQQIGRLVDGLDRQGLLANTWIVVTADHGEHFGEHDLFGHASSLYDPEIHVPLLILPPAGAGEPRSVTGPVSLRDLPATVVDLLGLGGGSPFPGRSLARHWDPAALPDPEPILSEVDGPAKSMPNLGRSPAFLGPMKAIAIGQEVYIRNADGVEEVYDLAADPSQTRNLVGTSAGHARLEEFRSSLDRMTRDDVRPDSWRNSAGPRRQLGTMIDPKKPPR